MHLYSFEKLEVWKDSINLTVLIYKLTKAFPDEEKFGLTSQMRRSAVSISSNIAEGISRSTNKDKAHFINLTYSSTMELLNQSIITEKLNYISNENYVNIRLMIEAISNKLNALRKHFQTT